MTLDVRPDLTQPPQPDGALFADIGCGMWSVTPYRHCEYRCVYCCTNAQGPSKPLAPRAEIVDAVRALVATDHPFLILGAFSDAYPPIEAELRITRGIVDELTRADAPFTIVTKGTVVRRDLDLLRRGARRANVQVSVCAVDDDALRKLDLRAPSGSERFELIDELHAAGVTVGCNALPWIPDVSDTAAIIDRVPPGVEIIFSPLSFGPERDSMRLLGRTYTRTEVWERYLAEYERFGHAENTRWIRPTPPPEENNAMYRLPRITRDATVPLP